MTSERAVISDAFPSSLAMEVNSLLDKLNWTTDLQSSGCFTISLEGQRLTIPYRIYCEEPVHLHLTDTEALLLDCILTRHHNGYLREKSLRRILTAKPYFATPFIAQLLGEYVIEILSVIQANLSSILLDNLIQLKKDNPEFFNLTEKRVQSYWNCFFKGSIEKSDYVGFQLLKAIQDRTEELKSNLNH